jgi:TPR repeat protein
MKIDARDLANVGCCFHAGPSTPQNRAESLKYFRAAAELGNAIEQFKDGMCCCERGRICVDLIEAFEDFIESSDQNYPPAQLAPFYCLSHGGGAPHDVLCSHCYFSLAVESGMVIEKE